MTGNREWNESKIEEEVTECKHDYKMEDWQTNFPFMKCKKCGWVAGWFDTGRRMPGDVNTG